MVRPHEGLGDLEADAAAEAAPGDRRIHGESVSGGAILNGAMSESVERLIEELDRSYGEAQERMSDPAVFSDRQAAAEAGKRLKDLEVAHKLAEDWRATHDDLEAARADGELHDLVPELEQRLAEIDEELKLALV